MQTRGGSSLSSSSHHPLLRQDVPHTTQDPRVPPNDRGTSRSTSSAPSSSSTSPLPLLMSTSSPCRCNRPEAAQSPQEGPRAQKAAQAKAAARGWSAGCPARTNSCGSTSPCRPGKGHRALVGKCRRRPQACSKHSPQAPLRMSSSRGHRTWAAAEAAVRSAAHRARGEKWAGKMEEECSAEIWGVTLAATKRHWHRKRRRIEHQRPTAGASTASAGGRLTS